MLTLIEGDGATAGDTRRITEWLAEHHADVDLRGPPRRPAALPVLPRHRVSAPVPVATRMTTSPITYAELAEKPLTELGSLRTKPKKVEALRELGIETVLDLLTTYPRRYIDRSHQASIRDLRPGMEAMVIARVVRIASRRTRGRPPRTLVTADITDGAGHLRITFFNQGWRERQLPAGTEAVFFGKVDTYQGRMQMTSPLVDLIGDKTGRIVALYPQSEKLRITTMDMSGVGGERARQVPGAWTRRAAGPGCPRPVRVRRPDPRDVGDPCPGVDGRDVGGEATAGLRRVVAGSARARVAQAGARTDGHRDPPRHLVQARRPLPRPAAVPADRGATSHHRGDHRRSRRPPSHAPVAARRRREREDGRRGRAHCSLRSRAATRARSMAPTEVLAEQHYSGIRELLDGFEVPANDAEDSLFAGQGMDRALRIELLTNRTTPMRRSKLADALGRGDVDILIGTHALIEDAVTFRSLGAVVIDEQHRFGVEQRAALRQKGASGATPDVLVMTATPIPRTAAMTVYGDLDVSVLDEMPPGRTPITTRWVRTEAESEGDVSSTLALSEAEDAVWDKVRAEVEAGRQAYVVCPLIEESDKLQVRSAEETFARLETTDLVGLRLGLLHGRMSSADKEATMASFRSGDARRPRVDDRDRSGRRRPQRDGDGDPRRRSVRHRRSCTSCADVSGAGAGPRGATWSAPAPRPMASAAWRRWWRAPTGSNWPRSTSTCAARARSWGSDRRAATT